MDCHDILYFHISEFLSISSSSIPRWDMINIRIINSIYNNDNN